MPFTPYHMGPGMLFKAFFQGSFSILLFGWTQVLVDLQPLIVLITGVGNSHGFSHTYLGSSLIAVFAGISGKYIFEGIFKIIKNKTNFKDLNITYSWKIVYVSTFIGSFSHIILDSMCHPNMNPFYPFDIPNHLYRIISFRELLIFCVLSALAGIFLYLIIKIIKYKKL